MKIRFFCYVGGIMGFFLSLEFYLNIKSNTKMLNLKLSKLNNYWVCI